MPHFSFSCSWWTVYSLMFINSGQREISQIKLKVRGREGEISVKSPVRLERCIERFLYSRPGALGCGPKKKIFKKDFF